MMCPFLRAQATAASSSGGAPTSISLATAAVKLWDAPLDDEMVREAVQRQGDGATLNSGRRLFLC
jgi:hypothetical protein